MPHCVERAPVVTALLIAVDWEDARAVVVGIAMLTSTPGSPLPTAMRCRLPAVDVCRA